MYRMSSLLQFVGTHLYWYYIVAVAALVWFVALAVSSDSLHGRWRSDSFLVLAASVTIFAWRWPSFLEMHALNPDEGLWVAGALKATRDLAPWRGFDGTTSGPLTTYVLALPALFGFDITYTSSRIVGAALLSLVILALFLAMKWTVGKSAARLAIIPPVLFLALVCHPDFVHIASEYVPVFLTTVALAAAAKLINGGNSIGERCIAAFAGGLCLGAAGFAKLQTLPIAAVGLLFCLIGIAAVAIRRRREMYKIAALFLIGILVAPASILGSLYYTGTLRDAAVSYIWASVAYVAKGTSLQKGRFFFNSDEQYTVFLVVSVITIAAATTIAVASRVRDRLLSLTAGGAIALVLAAYFAAVHPGRLYPHYLLLVVVPITCCVGVAVAFTLRSAWVAQRLGAVRLGFGLFATVPALAGAMAVQNPYAQAIVHNALWRRSAVGNAIAEYARPGDWVTIWGWMADYYVETGTIMATRDAQTAQQIAPVPYRDYFRARYLSDIRASQPRLFIDAIAPGSFRHTDRIQDGFETFPELAEFINAHYTLAREVDGVRIFVAVPR